MNPKAAEELGLLPYDSADYLRDEEDIAAYLQVAMTESAGDPAVLVRAQTVAGRARIRLQHERVNSDGAAARRRSQFAERSP